MQFRTVLLTVSGLFWVRLDSCCFSMKETELSVRCVFCSLQGLYLSRQGVHWFSTNLLSSRTVLGTMRRLLVFDKRNKALFMPRIFLRHRMRPRPDFGERNQIPLRQCLLLLPWSLLDKFRHWLVFSKQCKAPFQPSLLP